MRLFDEVLERRRALEAIKQVAPFADRDIAAALAPFAPSTLASIVESKVSWLERRAALHGLAGRLDGELAARVLERLLDPAEQESVRREALKVLTAGGRAEIVPALRELRAGLAAAEQKPYELENEVAAASARLGDLTAALPALRLRYDAWSHRRQLGDEAVRALEAVAGVDAVARGFGAADASAWSLEALALEHDDPCVRRWAVDVAPPDAPFLSEALGDDEWVVAEGAHAALVSASDAVEPAVMAVARDASAPPAVRARAILVLLRRGRCLVARALWSALDDRHIALPGVPASVRRTVLHHYLPGERGTDPRWLLEGVFDFDIDLDVDRETGPDEPPERVLEAARAALASAGFAAGEATPIGVVRRQGGGTYRCLEVEGRTLDLCELGRFIACEDALPQPLRAALEQAGFLFIEGALAQTVFEGLGVYFFGDRGPLRVYDLLFYWQD